MQVGLLAFDQAKSWNFWTETLIIFISHQEAYVHMQENEHNAFLTFWAILKKKWPAFENQNREWMIKTVGLFQANLF